MSKGVYSLKLSNKMKISILCLFVIIGAVAGIALFIQKSNESSLKSFTQISEGMSKNLNQLRNTPGITLTGLAADPSKKLFKIGINVDVNKITSNQLKEVIESYLVNTVSFASGNDWKNILKPYNLRIEELHSGKLLAEKPLGYDEIIWSYSE